jgi:hypothetical protein
MPKSNPQHICNFVTKGSCELDLFTSYGVYQYSNHVMSHLRMAVNPDKRRDDHMSRLCIIEYLVK